MRNITFSNIKKTDSELFSDVFNQFMEENYNRISITETFKHHVEEKIYTFKVTFYYTYLFDLKGYYGIVVNQDVSFDDCQIPVVQLYHISSNKNGKVEPTSCFLYDSKFPLTQFISTKDLFYWCKNKDLLGHSSKYKENLFDCYVSSLPNLDKEVISL